MAIGDVDETRQDQRIGGAATAGNEGSDSDAWLQTCYGGQGAGEAPVQEEAEGQEDEVGNHTATTPHVQ